MSPVTERETVAKTQTSGHGSAPVVRCPSCNSSLRGEKDGSVRMDDGEMRVTFRCFCDKKVTVSVAPVPSEGRRVEVSLGGEAM